MKDENIENYQKILEYVKKFKKLNLYMKEKDIVNCVKDDMKEIIEIQRELQYKRSIRRSI